MNMMQVVPKVRIGTPILEDFAYLARNMRPDEIDQFVAMTGVAEYNPDIAARCLAAIPGYTWVLVGEDGLPFLVGGFQPIRPGVYEGWLAGTMEGWERHGFEITRICRRQMDALLRTEAHRVYVPALSSRTAAHDWYMRGLGMVNEGLQKGFCANKSDAIMFAKVRGDE